MMEPMGQKQVQYYVLSSSLGGSNSSEAAVYDCKFVPVLLIFWTCCYGS